MTIKEFYDWALSRGVENFQLRLAGEQEFSPAFSNKETSENFNRLVCENGEIRSPLDGKVLLKVKNLERCPVNEDCVVLVIPRTYNLNGD